MPGNPPLTSRLTVMLIFLGMAMAAPILASSPSPTSTMAQGIAPGDYVEYHLAAFDQDGRLVYTTNEAQAMQDLATGESLLNPERDASQWGQRAGVFELPPATSPVPHDVRFSPSLYLQGYREGDLIHTPYFLHPFGRQPVATLPDKIGPLATELVIDLDEAYADGEEHRGEASFGPREALAEGATIPYVGALSARVTSLEESIATLSIDQPTGEVIHSDVLGMSVIASFDGDAIWLEPVLEQGQEFTTQGCNIPGALLLPGTYNVTDVHESGFVLARDMTGYEHLLQPLRFEIQITTVHAGP